MLKIAKPPVATNLESKPRMAKLASPLRPLSITLLSKLTSKKLKSRGSQVKNIVCATLKSWWKFQMSWAIKHSFGNLWLIDLRGLNQKPLQSESRQLDIPLKDPGVFSKPNMVGNIHSSNDCKSSSLPTNSTSRSCEEGINRSIRLEQLIRALNNLQACITLPH